MPVYSLLLLMTTMNKHTSAVYSSSLSYLSKYFIHLRLKEMSNMQLIINR
jgi:hypothetical protein